MSAVFSTPKGYQRLNDFPLDSSSVFNSLADLNTYMSSNGTCYQGQLVAVIDTTHPDAHNTAIYIIDKDNNGDFVNIRVSDITGAGGLETKIDKVSIEDSLTSTDATRVLSANQGKILKDFIDTINTTLATDNTDYDTFQKITDFIEAQGPIIAGKLNTADFNTWKTTTFDTHHHSPSDIDTNVNAMFVTQAQIDDWNDNITALANLSHNDLADIGTNTHAQIDTHIAATDNPHGVTKAQVGLGNVPNLDFSDASNITTGTLPINVLPNLSITSVQIAADEAAMLALTTQEGDVVIRTDESQTYINNGGTAGTMADFTALSSPVDGVSSIEGHTGVVSLADLGLDNVDNTADLDKPISTAVQAALDAINDDLNEIENGFSVMGVDQGAYHDGDTITSGMKIEEVLRTMLQKRIPPTYTSPTFSLNLSGTSSYEVGSNIAPTVTPVWHQNDAGAAKSYNVTIRGTSDHSTTSTDPDVYTATATVIGDETVNYTAVVDYDEGAVKTDNFGDAYPTGHILTGSITKTQRKYGKRKTFYGADTLTSVPTTSNEVRDLESSALGLSDNSSFNIPISIGDKRVVFAYPASLGTVSSIISEELGNMNVTSAFSLTTVSVEGLSGFTAIDYNVYSYVAGTAWEGTDTYVVTI